MTRNEELFARAQRSIPAGVNSPVRAFGSVGGTPRFLVRGEGPYVFDADGQRYIDYVGSWGPAIAGHAHPDVVSAVQARAADGLSFGAPTEIEIELAETLIVAGADALAVISDVFAHDDPAHVARAAAAIARQFTTHLRESA